MFCSDKLRGLATTKLEVGAVIWKMWRIAAFSSMKVLESIGMTNLYVVSFVCCAYKACVKRRGYTIANRASSHQPHTAKPQTAVVATSSLMTIYMREEG